MIPQPGLAVNGVLGSPLALLRRSAVRVDRKSCWMIPQEIPLNCFSRLVSEILLRLVAVPTPATVQRTITARARRACRTARERNVDRAVLAAAEEVLVRALEHGSRLLGNPAIIANVLQEVAAVVSNVVDKAELARDGRVSIVNLPGYISVRSSGA
jgi:hypothetical protein